jgi:hypothetical protein
MTPESLAAINQELRTIIAAVKMLPSLLARDDMESASSAVDSLAFLVDQSLELIELHMLSNALDGV